MIRLSRMADYGVVIMTFLAGHRCEIHTAQRVADATGLPQAAVGKLLKAFARAGLLESQRGSHGGYCLNRRAEDISIAEVVEAVEGPIALTLCVDRQAGSCDVEALCPMRGGWNRLNRALVEAFESVSLAAMAPVPAPPAALPAVPAHIAR